MRAATMLLTMTCSFLLISAAEGIEYNVLLDAGQEVPAPALDGASPTGTATVDVNTITGAVTVSGTFAGLTSNAAAAHIHGLAPAGSTAGVLVGLSPDAATAGNLTGGGTLDAAGLTGLLAGETYLNLHTGNNPAGEIRGQIVDDDIRVFNVMLDTAQELPPPTLDGATPGGSATVVVDVSSGAVEVSGTYSGMTSNVAAAHLHGLADPSETAGVIFGFDVSGGTEGTFSGSSMLSAEHLAGLLSGQTYLNVHTGTNPAGEIRGQVVPEPSAMCLILAGLLSLVAYHRRRRL